jgi:outer membrane protein TolC
MNSVGSSDVRRRQIELKAAPTQLKRTQNLFEQGLMSRTDLDRAETVVETA